MADQLIVAVFNSVDAAYEAARAIKGLKDGGDTKFKIKSGLIVTKDDRGVVSVLESEQNPFGGTKVGAVVGGLIGLIGGVPMVALGALLGATTGAIRDGVMAFLGSNTVSEIKQEMEPGKTAVIIEAHEASPNAVDDIVTQGGGRVFRQAAD